MNWLATFFILICFRLFGGVIEEGLALAQKERVVLATKKIDLEGFPQAHNPSILKVDQGYLLIFRFIPDLYHHPGTSHVGIIVLNEAFEPISKPQLLNTRNRNATTPSRAEDARIFAHRGRVFLIYNDCVEAEYWQRRDMYMAELFQDDHEFSLSLPLKLFHEEKYSRFFCQKNWVPFEYNKKLYITYSIHPHEVLYPNLLEGVCHRVYETQSALKWDWGQLRGSSPSQLVEGEYWSFFHSGTVMTSATSQGYALWHYFMGAYTFSAEPPFKVTKISKLPIVAEGFYTSSSYYKRVIFPGGFVVAGSLIYVAYGKDDCEIWIATLDKEALKKTMVHVE